MTETSPKMTIDRRFSPREIVAYATVLLNFGALVWGAAKLSATVDILIVRIDRLESLAINYNELITKQAVFSYRLCLLEAPQEARLACRQ